MGWGFSALCTIQLQGHLIPGIIPFPEDTLGIQNLSYLIWLIIFGPLLPRGIQIQVCRQLYLHFTCSHLPCRPGVPVALKQRLMQSLTAMSNWVEISLTVLICIKMASLKRLLADGWKSMIDFYRFLQFEHFTNLKFFITFAGVIFQPFLTHSLLSKILFNFSYIIHTCASSFAQTALGNFLPFTFRQNRSSLVVTTKFGRTMDSKNPNCKGGSRKHIMWSIDQSLKRLQTDYIDVYMVWAPSVNFGTLRKCFTEIQEMPLFLSIAFPWK